MTVLNWTYVVLVVFAVVGCIVAVRSSINTRRIREPKGAQPGQGGTLVSSTIDNGRGGGQANVVVPRDPQTYAKAMMPDTKKGKTK